VGLTVTIYNKKITYKINKNYLW